MGQPKLLLPWRGTSVLGHLIREWGWLGAEQIVVVHAGDDPRLVAELDRLRFPAESRIPNPAPDMGMFSSIRCAAGWTGWRAVLSHWAIVLGDQPHLRRETLEQLIGFAAEHAESVCQPIRNGKRCHPVVLAKSVFLEIAKSNSTNLKEFLQELPFAGCPNDDPGLELDIDRPEDYQKARALAGL